jgi:hypothetical protein
MAINTGGFQTSVLPQFTPVNPSLAAFNPSAAMEGAGQAVTVAQGLEQLKNMRQIHEENAKMSAAKNKILESEAKQKELLAWHDNEMAAAKLDRDKAEAGSRTMKARGESEIAPLETKNKVFSLGTENMLAPGARDIAIQTQTGLAKATPFLTDAMVSDAQLKKGASSFALGQQPVEQQIKQSSNASALALAPAEAETARIAAGAKLVNAQMAFNSAASDYERGSTSKERVEESEINLRNAQAESARATAQATASKNDTAVRIAEIKSQAKEKMFEKLNNTSKLANELGRIPVVSPSDNSTTTMSQLADKYFQVDSDGNVNVFDKGMFMQDLATMNPSTRNDLTAYQDLQRLRSMLVKDLTSSIESNLPKQIEPPKTKLRWDAAAQKMVEVK